MKDDRLIIETTPDATDPILSLKPETLAQINAALGAKRRRRRERRERRERRFKLKFAEP